MKRLLLFLSIVSITNILQANEVIVDYKNESPTYQSKVIRTLPLNIKSVSGVRKNILTNAMLGWRVDKNDNIIEDGAENKGAENSIFLIEYDFDLNEAGVDNKPVIHVPQGCVLVFQGGSFKNGTIDFHGALFEIKGKYSALNDTRIIDPSVNMVYPEWFYDDCKHHLEVALQRINDNYRNNVRHVGGEFYSDTELVVIIEGNYAISSTVYLNKPFKLLGNISKHVSMDSQISSIMIPNALSPVFNIEGKRFFECIGVQFCSREGFHYYSCKGVSSTLFSIKATGSYTLIIDNCSFIGINRVLTATPVDKGQKEVWIGPDWNISNNKFIQCRDCIVIDNCNVGLKFSVCNMIISRNKFDCGNYAIKILGAFGTIDINHNTFESSLGIPKTYIEGANVACFVFYDKNYIEPHTDTEKVNLLEVNKVKLVDITKNLVMSSKQVMVALRNVKKINNTDNGDFLKVVKK